MRGTIGAALVILVLGGVSFAGCSGGEPSLVLEVAPADAVVTLDGYAHPGGSPHEIAFKKAGRYELQVTKPGFKPVEMMLKVEDGERLEQSVELIPLGGEPNNPLVIAQDPPPTTPPTIPTDPPDETETYLVNIGTYPQGVRVEAKMPGVPERRPLGVSPLSIRLPRSGATEIFFTMNGYVPHSRLVVAPSSGTDVNLDITLEKRGSIRPKDPPGYPLVPDVPPIVDNDAKGYLSITTNPWTAVRVDGKAAGNTPLVNYKVDAGRHVILMENRDLGVRRKKVVNVRPGEHLRLVEKLN